jgi:hypothetical protein
LEINFNSKLSEKYKAKPIHIQVERNNKIIKRELPSNIKQFLCIIHNIIAGITVFELIHLKSTWSFDQKRSSKIFGILFITLNQKVQERKTFFDKGIVNDDSEKVHHVPLKKKKQ